MSIGQKKAALALALAHDLRYLFLMNLQQGLM